MAKIKLIESLRSIKRTTIRYNENQDYYLLAL